MPTTSFQLALLTGLGLGRSPLGPGTAGSLLPIAVALLLVAVIGPHWSVNGSIALLGVLGAIVCLRFGELGERHFGRKDPSQVVADEVAGQAIPLLFLPWQAIHEPGAWQRNLLLAGTAFVTFRLFDIVKPPPIRGMQRMGGGRGILVDDLMAGIDALIVTQVIVWFAFTSS